MATAGTYIQLTGFDFERYLQEYEARWNIDPVHSAPLQEYRERTLYTTWDLSYAHLKAENTDAVKLLTMLAYFGNQSVWYELFYAGLTDDSPEWLHGVIASDVTFRGVMTILTQYYFLEVDWTSGSWRMHNCVHDWTLAVLNKEIDIKHYWYAVDCVNACIAEVDDESLGHISLSRVTRHAVRLAEQRFLDIILDCTPGQLDKISRISLLLRHQIQLDKAEQIQVRVLSGYENALGPDHTSTLTAVHYLGCIYRARGKHNKAKQLFTRALAGRERVLGPDHALTITTIHDLGILYRDQGKLNKSEQMFMRALAGREKVLGPDHKSTLNTVFDFGILYHRQGKLNKAEQTFMRALAGREKTLGPDHKSTLATVHKLGILYRDQGKLNKAEQMFTRALQ